MASSGDHAAVAANSGRLDRVGADRETVPRRPGRKPLVEIAIAQLDDPVALLADEMVMVAAATQPVARLARMVQQCVDRAGAAQRSERPVHRRESDPLAGLEQGRMDLLRGGVVSFCGENTEDGKPLPGWAQTV